MGMSPSCHCICPGAGDVGSYSSQRADTIFTCLHCTEAARRYLITVPQPTVDAAYACCCAAHTGAFIVIHSGGCTWQSEEKQQCCKRDSGGNTCVTGLYGSGVNNSRFSYSITKSGANMTYRINMIYTGRLVEFPPAAVDYDYEVSFALTTTDTNCLVSRTLSFLSHTRVASNIVTPCAGNLSDGGPCTNGWRTGGVSPYSGLTAYVQALL